ncbi:MAG: hypothetical protein FJ306_09830 [Planctomycetes bacterium]|nr:hypothetical protein [Planctomycetota bacterium]
MPGTPLAGFLVQFFADAHAAATGGGRSTATDAGRRRFLAGASAAAIGARLPQPLGRARARKATERVAVVGAGLAGLTCSHRLRQRGVLAEVYEASPRLGGRCWTRRGASPTASWPSAAAGSSTNRTPRSGSYCRNSTCRWSTCSQRRRTARTPSCVSSAATTRWPTPRATCATSGSACTATTSMPATRRRTTSRRPAVGSSTAFRSRSGSN